MRRRNLVRVLSATSSGRLAATALVFISSQASSAVDHEACRPDGLYKTPGVAAPYWDVYDTTGRETTGGNPPRRIIGYFTSWRTGKNGQPAFLANQIPWDKVTHINYAFAHVDGANRISIGTPNAANNPATNMTCPVVA